MVMGRVGVSSPVSEQMRNFPAERIKKEFYPRNSSDAGHRSARKPAALLVSVAQFFVLPGKQLVLESHLVCGGCDLLEA